MKGDGDAGGEEPPAPVAEFDLPAVLARLDGADPSARRSAVSTVRSVVDHRPKRCLPTVPKLRELLADPEFDDDSRGSVAYCLAELAAESPNDVAPSAAAVAEVAANNVAEPWASDALRCLTHVAAERPDAVVERIETLAEALADADADGGTDPDDRDVDEWAISLVVALSRAHPEIPETTAPVVERALQADDASVRRRACLALGFGDREAFRDRLEELASTDPERAVRERAAWALEGRRDGASIGEPRSVE